MIVSLSVEEEGGVSATINLMPVTLITGAPGSGKSRLINILWNTFSNMGVNAKSKINWLGKVSIMVRVRINDESAGKVTGLELKDPEAHLEYVIEYNGKSLRQIIKTSDKALLVLEADDSRSMITHPIEAPVADAWSLISEDALRVPEGEASVLISSNEDALESSRVLMGLIRGELMNHRVHMLGPYFEYDGKEQSLSHVDNIGRNGDGVIRALAEIFMNPRFDSDVGLLRKAMAKLGYRSLRVGLFNGNVALGFRDSKGNYRIGAPLPCHLRTILAVSTQVMLMNRGDILLVDNLDYCMSNETWDVLMSLLAELAKDKYIIAEVHNYELVRRINLSNVVYSVVST
ncbi:ATP-binding protein [Caldivirga maquilingensis]|uniref:Uncharacterized protein n=1 Tax=Caldivirga maquilingensis (strain ATCC 700844 / DSM 13496 / JCM 10307 / IC-167) TaxID=397948 RepID=A8MDH0_CALMQ|nr:ATP-binding protein [Caldivirga maquilingensis]ABW01826.1 hypothetical protein Cmaq_0995 [Caldivirga maquilingensis IC-167]